MKTFILTAAVLAAAIGTAQADTAPMSSAPTCVWNRDIKQTKVVNPSTLLFYMKDGKVWQNNLPTPCTGLKWHGFVMAGADEQVCGKSQLLRVVDSHETCPLGSFTAYEGPHTPPTP